MVIRRDPGEWYLAGTEAAFQGPAPTGWVERVDPATIEPRSASPRLPCGDHVWCGAIAAHANGSLYYVNGSFLHKLSPECEVEVEARLPVDQAHNGLLILGDGTIVTKDLRLDDGGRSTISRVDPDTLELRHPPVTLPEPSMGRIAADLTSDGEAIYVPGSERIHRLWVEADSLRIDEDWRPSYRTRDEMGESAHGMAWDSCLSADAAWIMDNGDVTAVRAIFGCHPNGRLGEHPGGRLSWQNPAPWPGPQRVLRVATTDGSVREAAPFEAAGGGIIAPPVHSPRLGLVVCWDSINGGMAGLDDRSLEVRWRNDVRPTMQPVVFADSSEVVINDFTGRDELVVIDGPTGEVTSRADLHSPLANGMFLTPGDDRDVYYCSTLTVARVSW